MKSDRLDERMRRGECFHTLRVPPGAYIVVRVDGRSFSQLTERVAEKPFDAAFQAHMQRAAEGLLTSLSGVYAYTESDEISVLLPRASRVFDREVEKLVSLAAARAAATVSLGLGEVVEFDGRVWVGATEDDVVDYFRWRQGDAARCALNAHCYWALRKEGMSRADATAALHGATSSQKHELLFARGVNFSTLPSWQRRGVGVYLEPYEKEGLDPRSGETVRVRRRRVRVDTELPMKGDYDAFLRTRIADGQTAL